MEADGYICPSALTWQGHAGRDAVTHRAGGVALSGNIFHLQYIPRIQQPIGPVSDSNLHLTRQSRDNHIRQDIGQTGSLHTRRSVTRFIPTMYWTFIHTDRLASLLHAP